MRAKRSVFLHIRAGQNLCPLLLKTEMTPLMKGLDVQNQTTTKVVLVCD